jgi:hypothetical protein
VTEPITSGTRRLPPQSTLAERRVFAIRCRGFKRGVAQLGSALRSGRRGRGFKSRHPDPCDVARHRNSPTAPAIRDREVIAGSFGDS